MLSCTVLTEPAEGVVALVEVSDAGDGRLHLHRALGRSGRGDELGVDGGQPGSLELLSQGAVAAHRLGLGDGVRSGGASDRVDGADEVGGGGG
jgi:hypothetical protein